MTSTVIGNVHDAPGTQKVANGVETQKTKRADPAEVGWLFVQQYYTVMSREPHKLPDFYDSRSYFLHGRESDPSATYRGQQAIRKRIAEIDLKDCKVLLSDVDSQPSSNGGIIVQVIGQLSNKGAAAHKFVQTFWLAEQPMGYFVLNDIFRYLKEDIDDAVDAPAAVQPSAVRVKIAATTASAPEKAPAAAPKQPSITKSVESSPSKLPSEVPKAAPSPAAAWAAKSVAPASPPKAESQPQADSQPSAPDSSSKNRTWAKLAATAAATSDLAPSGESKPSAPLPNEKPKTALRPQTSKPPSPLKYAGDRLTSDGRRIPGPERDEFCIYVKPSKGSKEKLTKDEIEQLFSQYDKNLYCVINEKYNTAVVEFESKEVPKQLIGETLSASNGTELQILVRGGDNSRQQSSNNRSENSNKQNRRGNSRNNQTRSN